MLDRIFNFSLSNAVLVFPSFSSESEVEIEWIVFSKDEILILKTNSYLVDRLLSTDPIKNDHSPEYFVLVFNLVFGCIHLMTDDYFYLDLINFESLPLKQTIELNLFLIL